MQPRDFQVTFYATDPRALGTFWASALGYVAEPPPPEFASWEEFARANEIPPEDWNALYSLVHPAGRGPRILFWRVQRRKTSKNHVHLDVTVGGTPDALRAEADRLVGLGARRIREVDDGRAFWISMADPEGNEFCLQ